MVTSIKIIIYPVLSFDFVKKFSFVMVMDLHVVGDVECYY
jgi:nitrate reductase NapE component